MAVARKFTNGSDRYVADLEESYTLHFLGGDDRLTVRAGTVAARMGAGHDIVRLEGGSATIHGGAGNDLYRIVGNAGGKLIEHAGEGIDTVLADITHRLSANFERLVLIGVDAIDGTGNDRANFILGNGAANRLSGGLGADDLSGGGGNDRLSGGVGDDRLHGGGGLDTASYAAAGAAVAVDLRLTSVQDTGGAGSDRLSGIERLVGSSFNDKLTGNGHANLLRGLDGDDHAKGAAGNDWLTGGAGEDRLEGGAGNDRITGGFGVDELTGDAGADIFLYTSAADAPYDATYSAIEWIINFENSDRIDLSAIDAKIGISGHQGFRFTGDQATTAAGTLHLEHDPGGWGWLSLIGHVDGDGVPDLLIIMTSNSTDTGYPVVTADNLVI